MPSWSSFDPMAIHVDIARGLARQRSPADSILHAIAERFGDLPFHVTAIYRGTTSLEWYDVVVTSSGGSYCKEYQMDAVENLGDEEVTSVIDKILFDIFKVFGEDLDEEDGD